MLGDRGMAGQGGDGTGGLWGQRTGWAEDCGGQRTVWTEDCGDRGLRGQRTVETFHAATLSTAQASMNCALHLNLVVLFIFYCDCIQNI